MKTSTNHKEPPARVGSADGSAILIPIAIIPRPVFPCSFQCCAEEVSYPADMLHWYAKDGRWVCDNCWDSLDAINEDGDLPEKGMTLDDYIRRVNPRAAELLQNNKVRDAR